MKSEEIEYSAEAERKVGVGHSTLGFCGWLSVVLDLVHQVFKIPKINLDGYTPIPCVGDKSHPELA